MTERYCFYFFVMAELALGQILNESCAIILIPVVIYFPGYFCSWNNKSIIDEKISLDQNAYQEYFLCLQIA